MKTKSLTLAKKATLGAAATGAVFGLQHQAEAAVVYSGVQNVSASIGSGFATSIKSLNIDNAGVGTSANDFRLLVFRASFESQAGAFLGANAYPNQKALGFNTTQITKLSAGNTISSPGFAAGVVSYGKLKAFQYGIATAGAWPSNQSGFAGLKFKNGSDTFYGWVRLKWTDSADAGSEPNTLTAIDWAYNNTPNASILAGQTSSVPEPSRALLALASLGALALRRRRKAA